MKGLKPINTGLPKYRAFHVTEQGIATCLITDVGVSLPFVPTPGVKNLPISSMKALWDTGAEVSGITEAAAESLGLKPIDKARVIHAGGEKVVNVYLVNLFLPNNFLLPSHRVLECSVAHGKFEVLIGMDIICFGDISLSHAKGKTEFSFRMPAIGGPNFLKDKYGGQLDNLSHRN